MKRLGLLLATAAVLGFVLAPEPTAAGKKKPRRGVFGTINGKKFAASNLDGVDDDCVNGIYNPADGILTFGALECKPKRRRQGNVRKNYKFAAIGCTRFDETVNTAVLPYTIPCVTSGYTEYKTGRFRIPVSSATWTTGLVATNPLVPESNLHVRIDAFDGTNIRGVVYGFFDTPIAPATGTAVIDGELLFDFPIEVH